MTTVIFIARAMMWNSRKNMSEVFVGVWTGFGSRNANMNVIAGDVNLSGLWLKELPEFLRGVVIHGIFDCSHNLLTSLKNAPASCIGSFDCSYNKITSMQGSPRVLPDGVGGITFDCSHNLLKTVKGIPSSLPNGQFYCSHNAREIEDTEVYDTCDDLDCVWKEYP